MYMCLYAAYKWWGKKKIFISMYDLVYIICCVSVCLRINTSLVYRNTFFSSDFVFSWLTAKGE